LEKNTMLSIIALGFIFFLIICVAASIVALGSLPGKIALQRGHPYPDAVNAASWIGLATGVFWPVAFIWAFLPVPYPASSNGGKDAPETNGDLASLQKRLAALEAMVEKLPAKPAEDAS
jgi:hypothetical protein